LDATTFHNLGRARQSIVATTIGRRQATRSFQRGPDGFRPAGPSLFDRVRESSSFAHADHNGPVGGRYYRVLQLRSFQDEDDDGTLFLAAAETTAGAALVVNVVNQGLLILLLHAPLNGGPKQRMITVDDEGDTDERQKESLQHPRLDQGYAAFWDLWSSRGL
jgi:hypothetical protein